MLPVQPVDHTRFGDVDPEERKTAALPQRLRITKSNGLSGDAGQTLDVEIFKEEEIMKMTLVRENFPLLDKFSITPEEAAILCSVGLAQVYDWAKNDRSFPCFAVGAKTVIPLDALKEWINTRGKNRIGIVNRSSLVADIVEEKRKSRKGL